MTKKKEKYPVKVKSDISFDKKNNKRLYLSFELRIVIYTIIIILCLITSIFMIKNNYLHQDAFYINYSEKGDIKHNISLLNNHFYDTNNLDNDNTDLYITDLIKNIKLNYNYNFSISHATNVNFSYNITADIFLEDENGKYYGNEETNNKAFKHYLLLNGPVTNNNYDILNYNINKDVDIDYAYYNKIANDFSKTYNLKTNNYLLVSLNIYEISTDISDLNGERKLSIKIPLSKDSIALENKDTIDTDVSIKQEGFYYIKNKILLLIGILFILLSLFIFLKIIVLVKALIPKKNNYDKKVNKLLKRYDYIIVNTKSSPNTKNHDIVKIESFNELIDVHNNLKLPIMYYELVNHHKCYFYIKNNNIIYLLTIKDDNNEK